MAGFNNPTFDLFMLPDEHNELRAVLRDLSEQEIAPYAGDVDEHSRFPEEALKVLNDTGFSAVHVPEEFGGQGADAVATCIVLEEVARVCASSSLIPGVNKLGTIGLLLRGSDELKKQVLPTLASGDAMASYALSEREAGSDPAAMRTRADGDEWVLNGAKAGWPPRTALSAAADRRFKSATKAISTPTQMTPSAQPVITSLR